MTGREWRIARVLLGLTAIAYLVVGVWALVAPQSFYDSFPGGGRAWVSVDGPFNEHLVRDVGALNLAVATILVAAAWLGGAQLVRVAAVSALVWGVPHFLYHLGHLDPLPTAGDRAANVVSLGSSVVAPAVVLWLARRRTGSTAAP
ncbi:MAG TPA: hypothetical protein VM933_10935 [Acidimicrobiales bacterium]|nr:hypothetical protein [Acidimicrobiales bacterium]